MVYGIREAKQGLEKIKPSGLIPVFSASENREQEKAFFQK